MDEENKDINNTYTENNEGQAGDSSAVSEEAAYTEPDPYADPSAYSQRHSYSDASASYNTSDSESTGDSANDGSTARDSYSSRYNSYDYNTYYNKTAIPEEPKKKHGFGKFMKTVGIGVLCGVVACGTFFGCMKGLQAAGVADFLFSSSSGTGSTSTIPASESAAGLVISATSLTGETDTDDSTVVDVVKNNMSCTVAINCTIVQYQYYFGQKKEYTSTASGTGFIVGSNDTELLIATNNHVVEDASTVQVVFVDDSTVDASVRATDANNDLAIVSVPLENISSDTMAAISIATLGSSDDAEVGQMVIAIGNALGYGQSVTVGYLSAKNRSVTIDGVTMSLLQTDAAINEGNSGGPLFNTNGEVIGINCAKYSDTSVEGMCFAIPISAALPILEDLMTKEVVAEADQGYLGVSIIAVPSSYITMYGWPAGIYINEVVEGYAADNAGLYAKDIITAVNGVSVTTTDELKSYVNSFKYGTVVTITYSRYNEDAGTWDSNTVDVTLTQKPSSF